MCRGSSSIFINAFLDFTPTCFSKSLPSSGGRGFLRSYSSSLYCGCIWLMACPERWAVEGCNHACTVVHVGVKYRNALPNIMLLPRCILWLFYNKCLQSLDRKTFGRRSFVRSKFWGKKPLSIISEGMLCGSDKCGKNGSYGESLKVSYYWNNYTVMLPYALIQYPQLQLSVVYCGLKNYWKIKEINSS
jgi:hypothetical protein